MKNNATNPNHFKIKRPRKLNFVRSFDFAVNNNLSEEAISCAVSQLFFCIKGFFTTA